MESSSEEATKSKRTPQKRATAAKRAPRRAAAKKAVRKRAPRKAAAAPTRETERETPSTAPERKAPTPLASSHAAKRKKRNQHMTIVALLVVGIGTSAAIGFTDKGQINVNETIEARNERVRTNTTDDRDVTTGNTVIPVQNTNQKPDGGLVGRGETVSKPKPVPTASTTATSSDATASSTEATASSTAEVIDDTATSSDTTSEEAAEPVETEETAG